MVKPTKTRPWTWAGSGSLYYCYRYGYTLQTGRCPRPGPRGAGEQAVSASLPSILPGDQDRGLWRARPTLLEAQGLRVLALGLELPRSSRRTGCRAAVSSSRDRSAQRPEGTWVLWRERT